MLRKIESENAPKAIGPYSQGICANGFVFVSGQLPIDPQTGKLAEGEIKGQARQVFKNIRAILQSAGLGMESIVRIDLFLADINDFKAVNEVFGEILVREPKPARQTLQAAALPLGAKIEISCVALAE